jgi:hypothetical protein
LHKMPKSKDYNISYAIKSTSFILPSAARRNRPQGEAGPRTQAAARPKGALFIGDAWAA